MIHVVLSTVVFLLTAYSFLIFIRILLLWFSPHSFSFGKPYKIICGITDPFLYLFSRIPFLHIGRIDLSPILALAVLSVTTNIVGTVSKDVSVTLGLVLFMILSVVWSVVSFILVFFIIVLMLRLIAYIVKANVYNAFWQIIESIARPVMNSISAFVFRNRITRFSTSLITALSVFIILFAASNLIMHFLSDFLLALHRRYQ